jgi:hypothetical protein
MDTDGRLRISMINALLVLLRALRGWSIFPFTTKDTKRTKVFEGLQYLRVVFPTGFFFDNLLLLDF